MTDASQLAVVGRGPARADIEKALREHPERSNRQIAAEHNVDHGMVGEARKQLEAAGALPRLTHTVGADGKSYPTAPQVTADTPPPAPPPSPPPAFRDPPPVTTCRDFDWTSNNENIFVPEQRATAVYFNGWGQVVIRQERDQYEEDDVWVIISVDAVPALIERLQDLLSDE